MKLKKYDPQICIAQNDTKFFAQSARKHQPEIIASPEIKEVKSVKAVSEVKDEKTGKVITPYVKAIKAVKGRPAIKAADATDGCVFCKVAAKTEAILMETAARLILEGGKIREGAEIEKSDKGLSLPFQFKSLPEFRLAFKRSKGEGKYNTKAMELFKADQKVKAKQESDAKAEKEKAAKTKEDAKNPENKKSNKKEDDDAWGEKDQK